MQETSTQDLQALTFAIMRAQADYARCIDDDRLEEWPAFFLDPCLYMITTASNHRDGMEAGIVFANSRGMLKDRISALREANIYEKQAYRHILGAPCVLGEDEKGVRSETPFMVARIMRDGSTMLFATGRYLDTYRIEDGAALLAERLVVCDSSRIDTLLAIPL
ncbi:MAG: tphA [Hyphomicrobiales bacterium]|nr:tphA [Hyphomicrobiales bacterium]